MQPPLSIATGLVTGAPQLGAGAAIGTMAAIGGGALAGAAVGSAAVRGAASASSGAVKAGASLAGGAKLTYTLGSISQGGGIKGAAAGVGAMAQAGVRSITGKAQSSLKQAGEAISTAHGEGMRGGMRALSGGMKPATAAGDLDVPTGKSAPNWARKVQGQQQRRDLARAAHHTMGHRTGGSGRFGMID